MRVSEENYRSAQGCVIVLGKQRGDKYSFPKVDDSICRVGFTVTKKIGSAVIRNKIRRRFREAVMLTLPRFKISGYDYVVIAGKTCPNASYPEIVSGLHNAFKEIKRLHNKYGKKKSEEHQPTKEQPDAYVANLSDSDTCDEPEKI